MIDQFEKRCVPEEAEEKTEFAATLAQFGVSLQQYTKAFESPNVTMYSFHKSCMS